MIEFLILVSGSWRRRFLKAEAVPVTGPYSPITILESNVMMNGWAIQSPAHDDTERVFQGNILDVEESYRDQPVLVMRPVMPLICFVAHG